MIGWPVLRRNGRRELIQPEVEVERQPARHPPHVPRVEAAVDEVLAVLGDRVVEEAICTGVLGTPPTV